MSRFSRQAFGGDEAAAHAALLAHEATLLVGSRVRLTSGALAGRVGIIESLDAPGSRCVRVRTEDGLGWSLETRNLELVTP